MFSIIKGYNTHRQIIGVANNDNEIMKIITDNSGVQNITTKLQTFNDLIDYESKIIDFGDYLYNDKAHNIYTHYQVSINGDESYKFIQTNKKDVYEVVLSMPIHTDIDFVCCESVRKERERIKNFDFSQS
jgi:hypothetical protein